MKYKDFPIRTLAIVCLLGASTALAAPMTLDEAFAAVKVVQAEIQEVNADLANVEAGLGREVILVRDIEQAMTEREPDLNAIKRLLLEARDNILWMERDLEFCEIQLHHTGLMFLDLGFATWFNNEELDAAIHETFVMQSNAVYREACDATRCEDLGVTVERLFQEYKSLN